MTKKKFRHGDLVQLKAGSKVWEAKPGQVYRVVGWDQGYLVEPLEDDGHGRRKFQTGTIELKR